MSPPVHVFDGRVCVSLKGVPPASARKSDDIAGFVVVCASALLAREIAPHENGLLGFWTSDEARLLERCSNRGIKLSPLLVGRTHYQHSLSQTVSGDIFRRN